MKQKIPIMNTPIAVLIFLAGAVLASAALPAKHSKEFPLRYECDVAPALAGWTLTPSSTVLAAQAANSWLSFTTSLSQVSAYRNSQWNVPSNQAYASEIRFRTPRRGRIRLEVDDGTVFRDSLFISSAGLSWNVNGVATLISVNTSNAMHTVRMAGWLEQDQRMVQIWQDGRSVYGPAVSSTASPQTGAATVWGDSSNTEEAETEIDYLRMSVGGAFAPFTPRLGIGSSPGAVAVTWSTAPGTLYQVLSVPDLTAGEWLNLGGRTPASTIPSSLNDSTIGQAARFYRVQEIVEGAIDQPWSPGVPPPICTDLPASGCVAGGGICLQLVRFDPALGRGYDDYPINGETAVDQYRSYVRREVRQAVLHAAARVECQAGHWPSGNNRPLGLGDMSEANGSIPGTREGSPSHPAGTHQNGKDIDIAYYQLDQADNHLRDICESRVGGVDQFHCVATPNTLDVWRTALFVGILIEHPRLRVIGVDVRLDRCWCRQLACLPRRDGCLRLCQPSCNRDSPSRQPIRVVAGFTFTTTSCTSVSKTELISFGHHDRDRCRGADL